MSDSTETVPVHLGLILDGNRRWARSQGLPTLEGHKKGYENLKNIAKYAFNRGVQYLSAYVFSTENWNRSEDEVAYLMDLLVWVAKHEIKELDKNNIKVVFMGSEDRLSNRVINAMRSAEERTKDNTGGTLLLCLNYGGQHEIVSAVNKILADNPGITEVDAKLIEANLYHPEVPAVDFIVRTSGEQRISNFMLWRAAYSEFYFPKMHFPAFAEEDWADAFAEFAKRNRRFGGNDQSSK